MARWSGVTDLTKLADELGDHQQDVTPEPPDGWYDTGHLLDKKVHVPEALVDGLVGGQTLVMLAAAQKLGKTVFSMHMGMAVATGRPFLGWESKRSTVLYANYEVAEGWMQQRLRRASQSFLGADHLALEDEQEIRETALTLRSNLRHVTPAELSTVRLHGSGNNTRPLTRLREIIEQSEARLVFLDPLSRWFTGRVEDNMEANKVISDLLGVVKTTGATIVMVHHVRKPSSSGDALPSGSVHNMLGSGAWANGPDTLITLTGPHLSTRRTLNVVQRHYPGIDGMQVQFMPSSMLFRVGDSRTRSQIVLDVLVEAATAMSFKDIENRTGVKDKTLRQVLAALVDAKDLSHVPSSGSRAAKWSSSVVFEVPPDLDSWKDRKDLE